MKGLKVIGRREKFCSLNKKAHFLKYKQNNHSNHLILGNDVRLIIFLRHLEQHLAHRKCTINFRYDYLFIFG